jgi:hypothetical protein
MGDKTSEVGYTIATTRRETTKVHKNMWWQWEGRRYKLIKNVKIALSIIKLLYGRILRKHSLVTMYTISYRYGLY